MSTAIVIAIVYHRSSLIKANLTNRILAPLAIIHMLILIHLIALVAYVPLRPFLFAQPVQHLPTLNEYWCVGKAIYLVLQESSAPSTKILIVWTNVAKILHASYLLTFCTLNHI